MAEERALPGILAQLVRSAVCQGVDSAIAASERRQQVRFCPPRCCLGDGCFCSEAARRQLGGSAAAQSQLSGYRSSETTQTQSLLRACSGAACSVTGCSVAIGGVPLRQGGQSGTHSVRDRFSQGQTRSEIKSLTSERPPPQMARCSNFAHALRWNLGACRRRELHCRGRRR